MGGIVYLRSKITLSVGFVRGKVDSLPENLLKPGAVLGFEDVEINCVVNKVDRNNFSSQKSSLIKFSTGHKSGTKGHPNNRDVRVLHKASRSGS